MLYSPGRRKEQRGMKRVARNNKERRIKCMRESRGKLEASSDRDGGEHEVVRPFKSWFFWPHRHSQNSSIYPIDVEQSHLQESTVLHVTIRAIMHRTRLIRLLSPHRELFLPLRFYFARQVSSARKIIGLRSRQEQNKPPTYLYCARGKIRRKKATDYEKGWATSLKLVLST